MKIPNRIRTYCPKCDTHTEHRVKLYKKGKESGLKSGVKKHEEKKKGYGGQKFPRLQRTAKTTKKETLQYVCDDCGYTIQKEGKRMSRIEIER